MAATLPAQSFLLEQDHGVLVVELLMDSITSDAVLDDLRACVLPRLPEAENAVLLDCRRLTGRVTSQLLATIVVIRRRAAAQGVLVCLCNVKGALREAYEITCLGRIIPVYESRAAALSAVGNLSRRERAQRTIERTHEEDRREAKLTTLQRWQESLRSIREGGFELTGRARSAAIVAGCVAAAGIIFAIAYQFYVPSGLARPRVADATPQAVNNTGLLLQGEVAAGGSPDAAAIVVAWNSSGSPKSKTEALAVQRYLNSGLSEPFPEPGVHAARALNNGKFTLRLGPPGSYHLLVISGTSAGDGQLRGDDFKKLSARLTEPQRLIGKMNYVLRLEEVKKDRADLTIDVAQP